MLNVFQVNLAGAESLAEVREMLKLWTNDTGGKVHIFFYTKHQSSCILGSHWRRGYHVKVLKFDCFLATALSA